MVEIKIGDTYSWKTIGGQEYTGVVEDIDNFSLIIRLPNGKITATYGGEL